MAVARDLALVQAAAVGLQTQEGGGSDEPVATPPRRTCPRASGTSLPSTPTTAPPASEADLPMAPPMPAAGAAEVGSTSMRAKKSLGDLSGRYQLGKTEIRCNLNVPLNADQEIKDGTRITAMSPMANPVLLEDKVLPGDAMLGEASTSVRAKKSVEDVCVGVPMGKMVLIRIDLNVPLNADQESTDGTRITAMTPCVRSSRWCRNWEQ